MKYELAKELKEAGLPPNPTGHQERPESWVHPDGHLSDWFGASADMDTECYVPTLEELIEAVQKFRSGNFHLRSGEYTDGVWKAELFGSLRNFGIGPTPTEAVARLWIALQ